MPDLPAAVGHYRKVVVAGSIGTFIEVYDLLVYDYLATILAQHFFLPSGLDPC
jgi:MHS family proline/betaine transporter-like MFS transporter